MPGAATLAHALPHPLPDDANARLALFAIRRLGAHGLSDAHAAHAFMTRFGEGFYLTADFMDRAETLYLVGADPRDPRASVLCAEQPPKLVKHLAPGYLVTAGIDPLRDEGEAYAEKLQCALSPLGMLQRLPLAAE